MFIYAEKVSERGESLPFSASGGGGKGGSSGMTKRQTTAIHHKPPQTTTNHRKPPPEFGIIGIHVLVKSKYLLN